MRLSPVETVSEHRVQLISSRKQFPAFLAASALSDIHACALNCDDGSGALYCEQLADFRRLAETTHRWLENRYAGNDFLAPRTDLERRDFQFHEILAKTRHRLAEIPDPLEREHLADAPTQIKLAELTQFLCDPSQLTLRNPGDESTTLFMAIGNLYRSSGIKNAPRLLDAPPQHIPIPVARSSDRHRGSSLTNPQKCSVIQTLDDISNTVRNANTGSIRFLAGFAGETLKNAAEPDRALLAEVKSSLERLNQRQFHFIVDRLSHQFDLLRAQVTEPYRNGGPAFISAHVNLTGPLPPGTHLSVQDWRLLNLCNDKQQILQRWREDPDACVRASLHELQRMGNHANHQAQRLTAPGTEQLRDNPYRNIRPQNPLQFVISANETRRSIVGPLRPIAMPSHPNTSVDNLPPLAAAVGM